MVQSFRALRLFAAHLGDNLDVPMLQPSPDMRLKPDSRLTGKRAQQPNAPPFLVRTQRGFGVSAWLGPFKPVALNAVSICKLNNPQVF